MLSLDPKLYICIEYAQSYSIRNYASTLKHTTQETLTLTLEFPEYAEYSIQIRNIPKI